MKGVCSFHNISNIYFILQFSLGFLSCLGEYCLALVLSVCQLAEFRLAWGLCVCPSEQVMFGMGFVCLCMGTSYVWHGVCLFVHGY